MAGTTPIYGLPYPQSSDLVSAYPALGQDLAEDLDGILAAKADLASPTFTGTPAAPTAANGTNTTQIATTAFVLANAPASGLTFIAGNTFSSTSSVIFNSAFTSTYANYLITCQFTGAASNTSGNNFKLRASGTDTSTNYNHQTTYSTSTTAAGQSLTSQSSAFVPDVTSANPAVSFFEMQVFGPQLAQFTAYRMSAMHNSSGTIYSQHLTGWQASTTQFDGITLTFSANCSGTVRIYGYKNS